MLLTDGDRSAEQREAGGEEGGAEADDGEQLWPDDAEVGATEDDGLGKCHEVARRK